MAQNNWWDWEDESPQRDRRSSADRRQPERYSQASRDRQSERYSQASRDRQPERYSQTSRDRQSDRYSQASRDRQSDRYSQASRDRRQPERGRPRRRKRSGAGLLLFCLLVAAAVTVILLITRSPVHDATVEAGEPVNVAQFVKDPAADTAIVTDLAAINMSVPGDYPVQIVHKGKSYDVTMKVRDTVPPTGSGKYAILQFGAAPDAALCVENVWDVTPVTVGWKQAPDTAQIGEQDAVARLTDAGGNGTDIPVRVKVAYDATAPIIDGARNIEAFLGDSIAYRQGVTVSDNEDPAPTLEIDSSGVNMDAEGVYEATYTATDATGNTAVRTVTVTIRQKPANFVEEDQVYQLAQSQYDALISPGMSGMQKAYAIYHWVHDYIYYVDNSDKTYWTIGAYQAFTTLQGDCFTYYSAAKALLNMAGIENIDVVKSDTSHSRHYWLLINLGSGWYHFDACPRQGGGDDFFMLTDAELEAYSSTHDGSHVFDPTLYPSRATQSVQYLVDYENNVVRG